MKRDPGHELLEEAIKNLLDATAKVRAAVSRFPSELSRRAAPTALVSSPRRFLVYCAFVRLMKAQQEFFTEPSFVLVINVPRTWPLDDFDYVAELSLKTPERASQKVKSICHPPRGKRGSWDFNPHDYLDAHKVVIFLPTGAELHPAFEVSADKFIDLELLEDRHLDGLVRMLETGPLSIDDKEHVRAAPELFDSIFRKGRSAATAIARLRRIKRKRHETRKLVPLTSYGAAGTWGLRLNHDLKLWRAGQLSWADVDRGVLLYGAPGTGKTSFAASLAAECDAHLVSTSLATWQSHGHLGDTLKAMRMDFAQAREKAPSILFIDEIDSVGDRRIFSGDGRHYCIEVVNALLECVDGLAEREGVIIVGATNFPGNIDPALLRSGRLETHIEIQLPDSAERAEILRFYLPELGAAPALEHVAKELGGKTGADLEHLARMAKQRARLDKRAVTIDDVQAFVPERFDLSEGDRWRICVHEAAHAVVAEVLDLGTVTRIEVFDRTSDTDHTHSAYGRTWIDENCPIIKTEEYFRSDIAMGLAGMAAEEMVCGSRSTTSGGSRDSDIVKATDIAAKMVAKFGLGRYPSAFPDHIELPLSKAFTDIPRLRADVDIILSKEYDRAKSILEVNLDALLSIAEALKAEGDLQGEGLELLLAGLASAEPRTVGPRIEELQPS